MAEKINIQVALESKLKQANTDIGKLKQAKVFEGPAGEKQLTKLNGIIDRLSKVDLSKLKGPELTKFLNDFSKLRALIDSSARSLTTYTKEFEAQQKVLNDAINLLNTKKTTKSEKLKLKKEALGKVDLTTQTYFNKNTQKQVTNIDTIIKLLKEDALEIRSKTGKTAVKPENYNNILEKTGIKKYKEASEQYEVAKQEVSAQQVVVNGAKTNLDKLPKAGDVHPLTKEVQQNSADAEKTFSEIRDQGDEDVEQDINNTTNAISKQIPVIEKQTSSLGRAFKQFTIYNIAIRAAKTALREAVQTVQELDKYLTEQAMVTGLTREQTYGLVKDYQNLALQCGATTKEIAEVSTEYMKQGKSVEEALVLTEAAVKAAKVARVSVGDSVNYLTTALNGFQLSAEDAMAVSDKFAAVAASSATDYDELAIALSKVASQANLAGMSIDYTTALLTKGLETTREAPETMGTALKTIIARMRELGDYGETLEGDTDINNVESQLAYVGIALRDANGELRSTEDVLDELGKKWDALNKNQQAALAKALAGTRQQSRLIALMDDYERVTELQEISQRSAGATAAQAGVYLEGIEASMNKIQVAWESIVMTVTDSDIIINVLEFVGVALDKIGEFLSTDFGLVATLTTVGILTTTALGNKLKEIELSKLQQKYNLQENKLENEKNITIQKGIVLEKINARNQAKSVLDQVRENKALITELKIEREIKKARGESTAAIDSEIAMLEAQTTITEEQAQQQFDLATQELEKENSKLEIFEKQNELLTSQESLTGSIFSGFSSFLAPLQSVISLVLTISALFKALSVQRTKEHKKSMKEILAETVAEGHKSGAKIISQLGVYGIPIAIAVIAALTGVALAIGAAVTNAKKKGAEGAAQEINKLSAEIYKLNEKAQAISSISSSFDKLDSKLIKTNEDIKEMNSLLDQVADKLSDEIGEDEDIGYGVGVSEKEYYSRFHTTEGKQKALEVIEKNIRNQIRSTRSEIINTYKESNELSKLLDENSTNTAILQAQDNLYAANNSELYDYIDLMKDSKELTEENASAVEALTQSILEEMNVEQVWAYAKDDDGLKVRALTDTLKKLETQAKNTQGELEKVNVGAILTSDDYSLKDKVKAYELASQAISATGDLVALTAFESAYMQYKEFTTYDDYILDFIDDVGLSIKEINKLYGSWEKLQKAGVKITQEQFEDRFKVYLTALADTQGDVLTATQMVFGNFLDDSEDALNAFISAYGDLVQVGVLNMGQNMDKTKNTINSFYEKALEWNEMSESDKAEFIQDNAKLFNENNGKELLKAFESGNYAAIEEALKNNDALQKQLDQRRREVAQELLIEETRDGDDRNEAYIAQLKEYEKNLNNTEELFKASLEVRLEQEEKQLEEFKKLKEEEQKAQVDALEKRKEAYEKYFEAINQEEEDEEYEEQANLLVSNLSKLGSSTNASAVQQTKELEKQLEELEEERLKELRDRAQEAVLENMDKEVEEINEKFDELLENNRALLAAMQGELDNPSEYLAKLLSGQVEQGLSANELQQYIGTLQSTYGGVVGGDIEDISVREENNQLFLTVNGKDIVLDTKNEENLFTAIMKALREVGVR